MNQMDRRRFMQLIVMGGLGMTMEGDGNKTKPVKPKYYAPFLADPNDFLIVQYDALNNPNLNLEAVVEESLLLGENTFTVPRAMAFGEAQEPTIYGAVGSVEEIKKAADNPLVLGVYARI